jgi:kynureninase
MLAVLFIVFFTSVGNETEESVYLCGNSLGLQPRRAQVYLQEEMTKWAQCGVEGHFRGARPWANIDETVTGVYISGILSFKLAESC